jgi:uncharacterized protein with FMN-binding domain
MRRMILTAFATVGGIALLLGLKSLTPATVTAATEPAPSSPAVPTTPSTAESSPAPSATSSPEPTPTATEETTSEAPVSGTYTGDTIETEYGPVQVQITVTDGVITAVDAIQVPSEKPRSQEIAEDAVPTLNSETLEAQSADIDAVSGASYTSDGYIRSLQSALDQLDG